MTLMRSPNYPAIALEQAIDLVRQIHQKNRTNIIDRESAARDMGYSGLTGRSLKLLGALAQFDLVVRAGKGNLKVSTTAVEILHGLDERTKITALRKAGAAPRLFSEIYDRFPEGVPSENVIRSYLVQKGYGDAALGPAIKSFFETNRYLELAAAINGHGDDAGSDLDSAGEGDEPVRGSPPPSPLPPIPAAHAGGYRVMEGERVVFSEETGSSQYLKLVASGDMDDNLLEALEDFIKRQRKRLGVAQN